MKNLKVFKVNFKNFGVFYCKRRGSELKYLIIIVMVGSITYYMCSFFMNFKIFNLILLMIICTIVPNILFILIYHNNEEFKYLITTLKNIYINMKKKKNML